MDEWTYVGWVDPVNPAADRVERNRVLDSFLSQHGLDRRTIDDDDIRIDVTYLGPDKGTCGYRLMVRTAALSEGPGDAARGPA